MVRIPCWHRVLIAGAVLAVLLAWLSRKLVEADRPPAVPVAATSAAIAPTGGAMRPAAAPAPAQPSLATQVERLIATGDPVQAYLAYRLVQDCAQFNLLHDRLIFDQSELQGWESDALPGYRSMSPGEKEGATLQCSDMTERQRLSRLDHLSVAAKAGVPGAAVAFALEGPFGDPTALLNRPQDPLVQEWKATAMDQLTRSAESGSDIGALAYLGFVYGSGSDLAARDPLLAYRYRMAAALIEADMAGPRSPAASMSMARQVRWHETVEMFAPERRSTELAAARRIAANAKAHLRRARQALPPSPDAGGARLR